LFLQELQKIRLVPVVVIDKEELALPLASLLAAGGLTCVEVTLRTGEALAALGTMARKTKLLVGAGTVLSLDQAKAAVDQGAQFLVSPGISATLVEWCLKQRIPIVPGCATASEIQLALELGLNTVKFFPAEQLGGVAMLSALGAVFQNMHFMPTGGISKRNLCTYLSLPQVAACGGSWMVPGDWLKNRDFQAIEKEITASTALIASMATRTK
jgi:2-dehydro-3-deoxyphosphogluconate aldolase / (4S)-4-hydroxy-2-oxoglutarate aldolase